MMRRLRFWLFTAMFAFAINVATVPAVAQEKTDQELAEETFNEGAKAYLAGDYSEAVVKFLTAFEHKENAMILYNLSLAYAGMGNWERAIEAAQRADARDDLPDKVRPRNTARVVALERIVTTTQIGAELSDRNVARQSADTDGSEPDSGGPSALGWAGVGVAAAGLGALGYSVALELALADRIDAFEANPTTELRNEIESEQQFAQIVLFSGAGLLATGAILFIVDYSMNDTTSVAVSPTQGGANVDVTLRF